MDEIELVLSRDHYPQLLKRYSLEDLKKMAIDMALAQYRERPLTAAMLYSCLANLEVDLERMFPPPKTPEQKAAAEEEADEEEQKYQERIAEMEPYLVNGQQAEVNENGEFLYLGNPTGDWAYPEWEEIEEEEGEDE